MFCFPKTPIYPLSILMMIRLLSSTAAASTISPIVRPTAAQQDIPTCYVELPGQSIQNLDRLCGENIHPNHPLRNIIDLHIDTNGDGISDQLLARVEQLKASLAQARNAQERAALRRQFDNQLPYSEQVQKLREQRRNLQQQIRSATSQAQKQELSQQVRSVNQQIHQDPSYQTVRQEMRQINRKLRNP